MNAGYKGLLNTLKRTPRCDERTFVRTSAFDQLNAVLAAFFLLYQWRAERGRILGDVGEVQHRKHKNSNDIGHPFESVSLEPSEVMHDDYDDCNGVVKRYENVFHEEITDQSGWAELGCFSETLVVFNDVDIGFGFG